MGKVLLAMFVLGVCLSSLRRPWIGIVSYYLFALLGPQYIWWWAFEGLRVSQLVAIFAVVGGIIHVFFKGFDTNVFFKSSQNAFLILLWFFLALSYYLGPYVSSGLTATLSPDYVFSLMNKIFLFYFTACLVVHDIHKIRYLCLVLLLTAMYMIYWANSQYFTGNWAQFENGRLMGPFGLDGGSIYRDSNAFAMLVVTGIPFIFYFGNKIKSKICKYGLWLLIPLGFHAVFLTGSRGGLLGIVVTMLIALIQNGKKKLIFPVLILFYLFYLGYAGSLMKDRGGQISDYQGESSAEDRLTAWRGGLRMVLDNPITGAGLGTFEVAVSRYINVRNMAAHNTFITYLAESGVGAGACYVFVIICFMKNSFRISDWCKKRDEEEKENWVWIINNTSTASFAGLVVCSLFLSLNTYEVFFYLVLINYSLVNLCFHAETNSA